MADYEKYKNERNITFLGICTSTTATLKSMKRQVNQFHLKPFANMLDAGRATAVAYQVPENASSWLTVIDSEGAIVYNRSGATKWAGGPNDGEWVHHTAIAESLRTSKGILTIPNIPAALEPIAHYFDLQQFVLLENSLRRVERGSWKEGKMFAAQVRKQITEFRENRLRRIQELAEEDPLRAYREAKAFAAAFARAPEKRDVVRIAKTVVRIPEVRKELNAEAAYQRIMVPQMKKASTLSLFTKRIDPLLAGYLKAYGETEYAATVKNAVEAHKRALQNGPLR